MPKIRIPLSWLIYSIHVLRNTKKGDVLVIDNYELIYVLACYFVRLFKKTTFILDYEDGKHLIDKSFSKTISTIAEFLGRRLISGAILAAPGLAPRLPDHIPTVLIPGIYQNIASRAPFNSNRPLTFLYSGSLDAPRGILTILGALDYLPETGWLIHITGSGPLAKLVEKKSNIPTLKGKLIFHGAISEQDLKALQTQCDIGLNTQMSEDAISGVTFPSKVFSYLNNGLSVLSSRASKVDEILGEACIYFSPEAPTDLATAMASAIEYPGSFKSKPSSLIEYSPDGTTKRLQNFMAQLLSE